MNASCVHRSNDRINSETNITVLLGQYRGNQLTQRGQDLGYHAQSQDSGCQRGQVVTRCSDVQQECCTAPSTQGLYGRIRETCLGSCSCSPYPKTVTCVQQWVHPNGIECTSQFSYEPLLQQGVLLLEEEEQAGHLALHCHVRHCCCDWAPLVVCLAHEDIDPFPELIAFRHPEIYSQDLQCPSVVNCDVAPQQTTSLLCLRFQRWKELA